MGDVKCRVGIAPTNWHKMRPQDPLEVQENNLPTNNESSKWSLPAWLKYGLVFCGMVAFAYLVRCAMSSSIKPDTDTERRGSSGQTVTSLSNSNPQTRVSEKRKRRDKERMEAAEAERRNMTAEEEKRSRTQLLET